MCDWLALGENVTQILCSKDISGLRDNDQFLSLSVSLSLSLSLYLPASPICTAQHHPIHTPVFSWFLSVQIYQIHFSWCMTQIPSQYKCRDECWNNENILEPQPNPCVPTINSKIELWVRYKRRRGSFWVCCIIPRVVHEQINAIKCNVGVFVKK